MITLMRGLPGSGKSTWVKANVNKALFGAVFSTDTFFYNAQGVYSFDAKRLGEAHNDCLRRYHDFLVGFRNTDPSVVVDNTNISAWEFAPYYRLAEVLGYPVRILRIHCDPLVAWERNLHKVSLKTVLDMNHRLHNESLPPWWKEEIIPATF